MLRVLIVDDSRLIRLALRSLFEMQSDLEVCGCAASGRGGVTMALKTVPDVVVMDLSMPDIDGFEATRQIVAVCPRIRVVVLSSRAGRSWESAALADGATRCVVKDGSPQAVLTAVRDAGGTPPLP